MRRAAVVALTVAVLGGGCTEDRLVEDGRKAKPRCEALPGRGVEGFALSRTREIRYPDHIAVRSEYRDPQGRRLFYLLGVVGEMGEGPGEFEPVTLADGTPATFFGRRDTWGMFWSDEHPCPQMAVIGNEFGREDFITLMLEAEILDDQSAFRLLPYRVEEWVAVFRTAKTPDRLATDMEVLLEVAPANLIVGPVGCHQGLAETLEVDQGSYFSGLVAETRPELRRVLQVTRGRARFSNPLLVEPFRLLCGF